MTSILPGMGPTISKMEMASTDEAEVFVTVTPKAVTKAQSLLADKGFSDAFLRVFVVGGGCSGFQYGMSIAETAEETDRIVDLDDVRVVIDKDSVPMISGAEIDYVEDLMKSGFTLELADCNCTTLFSW